MVTKGQIEVRDEERRLHELRDHQQQQSQHSPPQLPPRQSQPQHQKQPLVTSGVHADQSQEAPHASGKVTGQGSHFH